MRISYWSSDVCSSDLFALGEEADAVLAAAGNTSSLERGVIDGRLRVELLRVDQLLDHAQIDDREVLAEDVVEAALRDAHVERHLAALEAVDRDAAARLLALLAAAGGLALTRADTASDAHPAIGRALVFPHVVTFYVKCFLSL